MSTATDIAHAGVQCALHLETWVDGWHGPPNWWASEAEFEMLRAVTDWRMIVDGHPSHWANWLRQFPRDIAAEVVLAEIQRYVEESW